MPYEMSSAGRALRTVLGVVALTPACAIAQGPTERFELTSGTLSFVGHATVGRFTGTTDRLSGHVLGDVPCSRGLIEAPVTGLSTGNRLRDRDMYEALGAAAHPTLRFELDSVAVIGREGDTVAVRLHGRLTVRGVTRATTLSGIRRRMNDTLHVRAVFPLDLTDFGVRGLTRFLGVLRVQPQVTVLADLLFVRSTSQ
jgi:polyisoprenoid-binding protein YceI